MCCPFREDIEIDSLELKITSLFHLNSSAEGNDADVTGWYLVKVLDLRTNLELTEEKYPKYENRCYLLDCIIWLYLLMRISLFSYKKNQVLVLFHNDWWSLDCLRLATCTYCPNYATLIPSSARVENIKKKKKINKIKVNSNVREFSEVPNMKLELRMPKNEFKDTRKKPVLFQHWPLDLKDLFSTAAGEGAMCPLNGTLVQSSTSNRRLC